MVLEQRYFPGIDFTLPTEPKPPTERIIVNDINLDEVTETIERPLINTDGEEGDLIVEEDELDWRFDVVLADFGSILTEIEEDAGTYLSMDNIEAHLVNPKDLIPDDEQERDALTKKYGAYILDGIAGDCTPTDEGIFRLRVGYRGKEDRVSKDRALEILAHEYGHTLGEHLDDPIFEEMKAYAFAGLVMRYYYYTDVIELQRYTLSPEEIHDVALYRVGQLTARGIREEAIVAHLTGKPFGQYQPNDYATSVAA